MAGTLTRLQMANEILDNLAKRSSLTLPSGDVLSTRVVRWLNQAQRLVSREADLLFKIGTASTVTDQQSYALPTDINALFSIRLEDGMNSRRLLMRQPWEFDSVEPMPSAVSTGIPVYYIPYKTTNTFELFPIPDAVYTMRLRYSYWAPDLSSDSSTTDFTYMDDVLICFGTMYGFRWLQESKDASYWEARGKEALEDAIANAMQSFPDWEPVSKGFDSRSGRPLGEYYNDPFTRWNP